MMTNAKPRKIEGRPAGDWLVCLLACGLLTSLAGFAAAQQGAPNLSAPETRQPLVGAPGRYELPPPSSPGGASAAETVPTPPPTPIPGSRQIIEDVQVIGNSFTSRLQIDKMLQTRKDRDFDPERLQKDVRTLIMSNLFRDVKTYTKQSKEGVIVVFELFERPRIHEVLYIGNRGISDKKLGKESGLKKGDPLSAFNVEDARRKIEELYHKKGFPKATVAIREGNKPNDKNAIFDINEGPIQRISGVTFEGNTIASASRLTTLVGSKPMFKVVPSQVDREKIDEDIKKVTEYYRDLGYFLARVGRELEFDDAGKWLTLKFMINEGPRYKVREIMIEGVNKFSTAPIIAAMKLKQGKFFNRAEMEADRTLLIDMYGTQGYIFVEVDATPRFREEPGELDLVYKVQEGDPFHVGNINVHIAGDYPHTKETVILNRMSLRHGDLVDMRELKNSERRLKAAQIFETNPQDGTPPRIEPKQPSLNSINTSSDPPPSRPTVRGQSPGATNDPSARSQTTPPPRNVYR